MGEKLKDYNYSTSKGNYVSERFKTDKGVYDFKVFLDQEIVIEEKVVEVKNGRDLEKYIRKAIKNYEENLETEVLSDKVSIKEMEEGITEVIEEIDAVEIDADEEAEEFEEELDWGDEIDAVFTKRKSPKEMRSLFEKLDAEIIKLDGVNFKTTTLDLVYKVNGQNFLRIRPRSKDLYIMTAQEWYKDLVYLSEETEIDNVMVQIKKSYDLIKRKTSNKK